MGLVPIIGDIGLAAWKANSRNAHLLEAYLTIRGEEFLAQQGLSASGEPLDQEVREQFNPGAGMQGQEFMGNGNVNGSAGVVAQGKPNGVTPKKRR